MKRYTSCCCKSHFVYCRHTVSLLMTTLYIDGLTKAMWLLLVVVMKLEYVYGARILLASAQAPSHIMMQTATGEELVERGHEVYIAIGSIYPKPELLEQLGLRTVKFHMPSDVLSPVPSPLSDDFAKFLTECIFDPDFNVFEMIRIGTASVSRECELMLSDSKFLEEVLALKFDIALVEPWFLNPCVVLLPYKLNIPFVSLENFYLPLIVRLPALPSFFHIPGPVITAGEPSLWNSVINTLIMIGAHWRITSMWMWNNTLLDRYTSQSLTWNELILKSELFFISNDHHIGLPYPLFPNVIPVPGITVRPSKPLPDKLEKLITQSRDGIILVSFGSMVSYFPEPVTVKFLEAFTRLKQTVIAKLSIAEEIAVPENVHVFRWLPQNDILSHQQTRLFVTHCGSNSQHEALYHGVPMLGFPLFAEQPGNCERAHAKGFGLQMNIHNFTSAELFANIQEMLNNKTYSDAIKHSSATLRDEPLVGPKKAAHWIEHVIKYSSAHIRSPAMNLPLYRFIMLDVLAIFVVMIFAITAIICVSTLAITKAVKRKLMHYSSEKKVQ